nr:TetR family transcriptional regulator C-terminal domain-containing protein [Mesorhizobium sp.]
MTDTLSNIDKKRGGKKAPRFSREPPQQRRAMMIEAATRCLSRGGISGFTVDAICREAGISRGLINHYFDSLDGLLVEVYRASMYKNVASHIQEAKRRRAENIGWPPELALAELIGSNFAPRYFNGDNLLLWLSLWAEIATNPLLKAAHRELYQAYRGELAEDIAAVAAARGRIVDAPTLARNFIALVDGLWLEWCLDETVLTPEAAEAAGFEMIEAQVGPLR